MATMYETASEPQLVTKGLIKKYKMEHIAKLNLQYVFQRRIDGETGQDVDIMRRGKPHYAETRIISGLNAFIAGTETQGEPGQIIVILVSKVWWNRMNPDQKMACMHQRLCEIDVEEGVVKKVDYDVHEFSEIGKIYGAWNDGLAQFLEVTQQMKLPIEPDKGKGARAGLSAVSNPPPA